MYEPVIGDIIGSTYELHNVKSENIDLFPAGSAFTDDTVLSVAVAEKILNEQQSQTGSKKSYALWFKQYYKRYPNAGFGQMFSKWALSGALYTKKLWKWSSYACCGNGFAYNDMETILKEVKNSCYYTHHHREAIKGAQEVATAIFMGKNDCSKEKIICHLE